MGRNPLYSAVLFALLGAVSPLQAQSEESMAPATAPTAENSTSASPSAPADLPAPEAVPAPAKEQKGDALNAPKATSKPANKPSTKAVEKTKEEEVPMRGATMSEVEKHFGKPRKKLAAVGKPPITRWVYRDYTVYFEREYVIHTVRDEDIAPPPAKNKAASKPAAKTAKPAPTPAPAPQSAPAAAPQEAPPAAMEKPAATTNPDAVH